MLFTYFCKVYVTVIDFTVSIHTVSARIPTLLDPNFTIEVIISDICNVLGEISDSIHRCWPMHATVAVLTAMSTWNDVMTPLVIMSGTGKNTLPLAQLNFQTQFGTNYNLAFASYLLALLPILIFYLICQKQIINGVVNGAVK